jgi:hypothetical protein
MLRVIDFVPPRPVTITVDGGVPVSVEWKRENMEMPLLWYLGDIAGGRTLLELSFVPTSGAIYRIATVLVRNQFDPAPVPDRGALPWVEGVPVIDVDPWPPSRGGFQVINQQGEFAVATHGTTVAIRMGGNADAEWELVCGRTRFGMRADYLCWVAVDDLTDAERIAIGDAQYR